MNIMSSAGNVHRLSGKRTRCRAKIGDRWQATNAPLTCARCISEVALTEDDVLVEQLAALGSRLVDTMLVIEVAPGATVQVRQADVQAWIEARLAARAKHRNTAVKYNGGGPPNGDHHWNATKI